MPIEPARTGEPIVIDVHGDSDSVDGFIDADGFRVHIEFRSVVNSFGQQEVTVRCRESGEWSRQEIRLGPFLDPAAGQKLKAVLGNKHAFRGPVDLRVSIRSAIIYDPQKVRGELDDMERRFKAEAEKRADKESKKRNLDDLARDRFILRSIGEQFTVELQNRVAEEWLKDPPRFYGAVGTGPAFILNSRKSPRVKLTDYIDWLFLSDLYRILGERPLEVGSPERELARGREIMALVSGDRDREFSRLSVKDVERLLQTMTISLSADFVPRQKQQKSDVGWQTAPQFGLSGGDVSEVVWHGRPDGAAGASWLAYQARSDRSQLKVAVDKPGSVLVQHVRGLNDWRYLRVVRTGNTQTFRIRLSDPSAKGRSVEIREPVPASVTFPF
ncbi:MAG: hypothetical protein ABGZ35_22830 [Planctomycetaceae bacterium]